VGGGRKEGRKEGTTHYRQVLGEAVSDFTDGTVGIIGFKVQGLQEIPGETTERCEKSPVTGRKDRAISNECHDGKVTLPYTQHP
jgi:hypothetical protein